jgi:hypothetical protein
MAIKANPEGATLPTPPTTLATVRQFAEQQPALPEAGIRWAIFNAHENGLADSGAIIRVGRKVLIDPDLYLNWLRTNPRLSPPTPKGSSRPRPSAILEDDPLPRRRTREQTPPTRRRASGWIDAPAGGAAC